MGRDGLSLYISSSKRCFSLTLSVILLVPICLFSAGPALGQDGTTTENPAAQAELELARSLRQNKQYPEATQAFTDVISRHPQTDYALQAYQGLALTQMDQQLPAALETVRQGLMQDFADHPEIAEAVYQVGNECVIQLWQGIIHNASAERLAYYDDMIRQICRDVLQHWPDSERAMWARRGIIFADIHKSDFAAAQAGMETLTANYSEHTDLAQVVCWLGNDYRRMKQYNNARSCYQYVADQWPENDFGLQSQCELISLELELQEDAAAEAAIEALLARHSEHKEIAKASYRVAYAFMQKLMQGVEKIGSAERMAKYDELLRRLCEFILQYQPDSEEAMWARRGITFADIHKGDYTVAETGTELLLSEYPDHKGLAKAFFWLGNDYLRMNQYSRARDCYQYVANQGPDNPLGLLAQQQLVVISAELQEETAAAAAIDALLATYGGHKDIANVSCQIVQTYIQKLIKPGVLQSASAERLAEYDAVIRQLCGFILQHHPDSEQAMWARRGLACAEIHLGDYATAQASIDTLLTDYPDHKDLAKALHFLGNDFHRMKQYDKARTCYQYAADLRPDNVYGLQSQVQLIVYDIHQKVDVTDKVNQLLTTHATNPKIATAAGQIGDAYFKKGDWNTARTLYQYICTQWPQADHGIWAESGAIRCDIQLDQVEDIYTAINFLTEKYQDHASLDRAILNIAEDYLLLAKSNDKLGQAEMAEQNYVKSLNLFNKIIQEMPDSQYQPHAHYMGGTCHVKLLQFAQGVEYYQMVVDNWPDFMYAGSAQSLVASYTRIRRDRGDIPADQADPLIQFACENIIANYKNCPTPHVYELALKRLGGLHMKHGRWEEAARYYETYRMEFPQFNTTSIILYNLAQIYESMGEPALAIDVCEEFIQTCPDDRRIDRIIAKWEELTAAN